jgi:ubiquinol-cytochrome c reductase cytochrome b subunit
LHKKVFWLLVADCIILVWIGQEPVEDPYILIGQLASVYFFVYFLIFMPFLGKLESFLIHYKNDEASEVASRPTLAAAR